MKKRTWKMSASCIGCLKACPTRFRLAYVEGLRLAEDTESQRVGTNWHGLLEVARAPLNGDPLDRAVAWLDEKYATVPPNKDATEWAVERVILLYSLAGWLWFWHNDKTTPVARELKFDLPLRNPETGRSLPNVQRVGKIDCILERRGRYLQGEYKSTTKSIDPDSRYWEHLNLDTQINCYRAAGREMDLGYDIDGTLYDVWHKPGIKPKMLTQADSKAFIDSGEYCGHEFETAQGSDGELLTLEIDGVTIPIIWGAAPKPTKKNPAPSRPFAIRETPDMFGTRLLQDICARPTFYFARREIARTDAQLDKHLGEVYHQYKIAREMERTGWWWTNEAQCEATFRCPYTPICYHDVDVFDGVTTPSGFRRIFDNPNIPMETE